MNAHGNYLWCPACLMIDEEGFLLSKLLGKNRTSFVCPRCGTAWLFGITMMRMTGDFEDAYVCSEDDISHLNLLGYDPDWNTH